MDNLCQLYLLVRDTCELAAYTKHVLADHNAHPLNDIHDSDPLQANYSEPCMLQSQLPYIATFRMHVQWQSVLAPSRTPALLASLFTHLWLQIFPLVNYNTIICIGFLEFWRLTVCNFWWTCIIDQCTSLFGQFSVGVDLSLIRKTHHLKGALLIVAWRKFMVWIIIHLSSLGPHIIIWIIIIFSCRYSLIITN